MFRSESGTRSETREKLISASFIFNSVKKDKDTQEESLEEQRIDAKGQEAISDLLYSFADNPDIDGELIFRFKKEKPKTKGLLKEIIIKLERDNGELAGVVICEY